LMFPTPRSKPKSKSRAESGGGGDAMAAAANTHTFWVYGAGEVLMLVLKGSTQCLVDVVSIRVEEAPAVVSLFARAEVAQLQWRNIKAAHLGRLSRLCSKMEVLEHGAFVLLEDDPGNDVAARGLWRLGTELRWESDALAESEGRAEFRVFSNQVRRYYQDVRAKRRDEAWLRGRLAFLRGRLAFLKNLSVKVKPDQVAGAPEDGGVVQENAGNIDIDGEIQEG